MLSRTPGKPLPADGGPAAKALLGLIAAVGGNALAPILAGLTPDEAKGYQETWRSPAENLESAKSILSVRLPKKPKVTGGEQIADDHVVLEVEGEPFAGSKMLYLVADEARRRALALRPVEPRGSVALSRPSDRAVRRVNRCG